MLVVVRPAGEAAAMTTRSPTSASPCSNSPASISAIISSVSAGGAAGNGTTPQSSVFARRMWASGMNA